MVIIMHLSVNKHKILEYLNECERKMRTLNKHQTIIRTLYKPLEGLSSEQQGDEKLEVSINIAVPHLVEILETMREKYDKE